MLLASSCSEVTKTLAEIVPYWNLLLVSIFHIVIRYSGSIIYFLVIIDIYYDYLNQYCFTF